MRAVKTFEDPCIMYVIMVVPDTIVLDTRIMLQYSYVVSMTISPSKSPRSSTGC